MRFVTIKLKPLEPLMLRGSGEFDPSSRGVYSYASSVTLPRPSTILGALVSVLLARGEHIVYCLNVDGWKDLLEKCYIEIFNRFGVAAIRGPYIIKYNKLFVPLMLRKKMWLLDYYQAKYLLFEAYGDVIEKFFFKNATEVEKTVAILRLIEGDIEKYLVKYLVKPSSISFTGIHLKSRGVGKTVREGYIYTANFVSYPIDVEIAFVLVLKNSSKILENLSDISAVKLGGEERVAKIQVEHSSRDDTVLNIIQSIEEAKYAILVSPMPLISSMKQIKFLGEYSTIGHGFSLAKKRRKPISPSIREGSIIKIDLDRHKISVEEAFLYGIYSVLGLSNDNYYKFVGRIGYGSFIPLV